MLRFFLSLALTVVTLLAQAIPGRYVVELSTPPMAEIAKKDNGTFAASDRQAAIRSEQGRMESEIRNRGGVVRDRFDYLMNALTVDVAGAQAADLEAMPGVVKVYRVHRVKPLLDRAAELNKVTAAWQAIGGIDKAGAGVKIGIIDTGIDTAHPAFNDASLTLPEGYPKFRTEFDKAITNTKVIAARSYDDLYDEPSNEKGAQDRVGHGTAVAMAAAGITTEAPLAKIAGMAPKAWLGAYRVFSFNEDLGSSAVILRAINDAASDGMDIINLSLGHLPAERAVDDLYTTIARRAAAAGILIVAAAGNHGPNAQTVASPGTLPDVLAVGAHFTDRTFAQTVTAGARKFIAVPGTGPAPTQPLAVDAIDSARIDNNALACVAFSPGAFAGKIAFILRGECNFEDKLNNAQTAGAVAAVVYTHEASPEPITMSVGSATLPAMMLSNADGIEVKRFLAENASAALGMNFIGDAFPINPNRLAGFSSRGPNVDHGIKPEMSALGNAIYSIATKENQDSALFDPSGYGLVPGTSFSAPVVAGAAAVLRAARPGLTPEQYKSLLVNSSSALKTTAGVEIAPVQTGAGMMNLEAAVRNTLTFSPATVSFGATDGKTEVAREVTVRNIGTAADQVSLALSPAEGSTAPQLSATTIEVPAGETRTLTFRMPPLPEPGAHQGIVRVTSARSGVESRLAYWAGVSGGAPQTITLLNPEVEGTVSAGSRDQVFLRVTDAAGIAVVSSDPEATAITAGLLINSVENVDSLYPGVYRINVRWATRAGVNRFTVKAGELTREFQVVGR